MRDFKNYDVWRKAHALVLYIYQDVLDKLPKEQQYEISRQLRRASYSIPMNIAEGCGRTSDRDFAHFLGMALGSANEVEYCTILIADLKLLDDEYCEILNKAINEIKAMLIGLIKSINK